MNARAIAEFRQAALRFVVSISGGGAGFISDYLAVPGASGSVIEAIVPYSKAATDAFLRKAPESYCSEHTARLLAAAAFERARLLEPETSPNALLGIGATASLASDRPKKGEHRVYCAAISRSGVFSASLKLAKGARDRAGEERLAADFILSVALFVAKKRDARDDAPWREYSAPMTLVTEQPLQQGDAATISWTTLDEPGADFLYGTRDGADSTIRALRWTRGTLDRALLAGHETLDVETSLEDALANREASQSQDAETRRLLFPGSFNPPHSGHVEMATFSSRRLGLPTELELSARNVDKPPLDALELLRRVKAIDEALPGVHIWVSNAPRFVEKAELAPGATFVMGADTILRLADPKYEGDSIERRDNVLARLAALHTRFLVYRRQVNGRVATPDELKRILPPTLSALCEFADEPIVNVSSTQLRMERRLS